MNERIKDLAEQCWEPKQYGPPWFNSRKFAELIIQECAQACEKNSYLALNGWQRAKQIREHFGVE